MVLATGPMRIRRTRMLAQKSGKNIQEDLIGHQELPGPSRVVLVFLLLFVLKKITCSTTHTAYGQQEVLVSWRYSWKN